MEYEQLERCYKTVMAQRDKAEAELVTLTNKLEDLREVVKIDIRKTGGNLRLEAALKET